MEGLGGSFTLNLKADSAETDYPLGRAENCVTKHLTVAVTTVPERHNESPPAGAAALAIESYHLRRQAISQQNWADAPLETQGEKVGSAPAPAKQLLPRYCDC